MRTLSVEEKAAKFDSLCATISNIKNAVYENIPPSPHTALGRLKESNEEVRKNCESYDHMFAVIEDDLNTLFDVLN